MSSNNTISFLLPDGNAYNHIIQGNNQVYYKNIAKEIQSDIPEEFTALYDLKLNKIISKYFDTLDASSAYKIFNISEAVNIIKYKENEITVQKVENNQLKETIKSQQSEIQDLNNLKENLKEAEKELKVTKEELEVTKEEVKVAKEEIKVAKEEVQVAKDKVQEQRKQLESQQEILKKLDEKDVKCDGYAQQCQKYLKDIESLQMQLQQSRQTCYQIQEQFQQYQYQIQTQLQQWQQYSNQLESEKRFFQIEKQQLDLEVKRLQKKIEQQEDDIQSKISDISKLKREKTSLDLQINDLKDEINLEQNKFSELQRRQKQEITQKDREISQKNNEIKQQQETIEDITEKYTKKIKEIQDQQEKIKQQNANKGQIISEEIQSFQRQLNQENELNEKLNKIIDEQKKKINELQASLDQQQQQIDEQKDVIENLERKLKSCQDQQKQDMNSKQQQIEQQIEQYKQLEYQSNINQQNLQELIQKNEEDNQRWKEKESNYQNDIQLLKETLEKLMNEKKQSEENFSKQRQEFVNQIQDCNAQIFQKDFELIAIQNSAIVPVYQFRIQRLVEFVPREYNKDIEFAIETMMSDKVNPENFLKDNEDNSSQLTFQISQIQLIKQKAEATLYNISDQDYRKCAEIINIGKMEGIQCFVPVNSSEKSLDRYYFFKCLECPNKKQLEGKIFGIKQHKKQDIEELETKETAIDNCLSTIIAQDFMNKFVSELQEKKANNILQFKFRDQYIIETKKDFKQVLKEQIKGQQLILQNEGIKNYIEFIESLNGEQSNEFYDFMKEYSTDKKQPKDGNIIQAFLQVYNDQKFLDIYAKFNPDNIRKQFHPFIEFIGGNIKEMPQRLYYSIQEIEIQPNFQKYNGGHLKFDTSQEGKFLSAFAYYSIVKSQRQMCISHLQGVQNELYDPLVSTYDGFLDKIDQGYNEIRTIESKFISEANGNKGIDYMKALGIK